MVSSVSKSCNYEITRARRVIPTINIAVTGWSGETSEIQDDDGAAVSLLISPGLPHGGGRLPHHLSSDCDSHQRTESGWSQSTFSHIWSHRLVTLLTAGKYCHNPSPSPKSKVKFQRTFWCPILLKFSQKTLLTKTNWSELKSALRFKLKIQFQNSIQDCDKVESNSSYLLLF